MVICERESVKYLTTAMLQQALPGHRYNCMPGMELPGLLWKARGVVLQACACTKRLPGRFIEDIILLQHLSMPSRQLLQLSTGPACPRLKTTATHLRHTACHGKTRSCSGMINVMSESGVRHSRIGKPHSHDRMQY